MRAEVAVIGGGLAGASFAALAATAGRDVLLIEREAGPHDKVCGEFLSREAQLYLGAMGIDLPALGAVPLATLGLTCGRRAVSMPLPFTAMSLSRRVLDEAVLRQAARNGARILRGRRVAGFEGGGLRLENGEAAVAEAVVLATGKHDLRGHARPPGRQNDLIGFKMIFHLSPAQRRALDGRIELTLFPGGYAGLQPIEGASANLCLVMQRGRFADVGRAWPALLATITDGSPDLARRLDGAIPQWSKPLTVAGLPYGLVLQHATADGLWRLGDQAAVIPSFSGDGMSIALHSARRAARAYLAGETAETFQRELAADIGPQVSRASWLSRMFIRDLPQRALVNAARLWPGALDYGVTLTRVPERALRSALGNVVRPMDA